MIVIESDGAYEQPKGPDGAWAFVAWRSGHFVRAEADAGKHISTSQTAELAGIIHALQWAVRHVPAESTVLMTDSVNCVDLLRGARAKDPVVVELGSWAHQLAGRMRELAVVAARPHAVCHAHSLARRIMRSTVRAPVAIVRYEHLLDVLNHGMSGASEASILRSSP